jgi:hypothetical protein
MENIVPKGMTFHVGVQTFHGGDVLPADVPDAVLIAMGLKATSSKPAASSSASNQDGTSK